MRFLLRIAVLASVSVVTWMMTAPLVAQYQKRTRPEQSAQLPPTEAGTRARGSVAATAPTAAARLGSLGGIAEVHLRSSEIVVGDGMAAVSAHVSIADKREDMGYVWRVRVLDAQDHPLAGQVYHQQIFNVEANGQREADFKDVVDVPEGAKLVELALYNVAPGSDLSFLDDGQKAFAAMTIRTVKLLNR